MSSRFLRKMFLAGLVLLTFGMTHVVGPAHDHEAGQTQGECQLCHVTAQPFLIATAPPATTFSLTLQFLIPEQPEQIRLRPCSPYGARAPPSA